MGFPLGGYSLVTFSIWCCGLAASTSNSSSSSPTIYHVDEIDISNLTCKDCDPEYPYGRREVTLYEPKNLTKQAGENARFRCVVPLKQRTALGVRWTHNGHQVEQTEKYNVRIYVWQQGLFTQLKIRNVTVKDTGEVTLYVPQSNSTFRASLTVTELIQSTVGQPCNSQRNCVENSTFCLMSTRSLPGKCLCRRDTPVYIREHSGCFRAAHGQDICFHSEQCRFFMLGSQCVDNHCQCPDDTVVAFGACLPALRLGSPCSDTSGRCSAFMSYCGDSGLCSCIPDAYEKRGACYVRQRTGGISDWRTWLCFSLALIAVCGVLCHGYCHRNAIADYCKHIFTGR